MIISQNTLVHFVEIKYNRGSLSLASMANYILANVGNVFRQYVKKSLFIIA